MKTPTVKQTLSAKKLKLLMARKRAGTLLQFLESLDDDELFTLAELKRVMQGVLPDTCGNLDHYIELRDAEAHRWIDEISPVLFRKRRIAPHLLRYKRAELRARIEWDLGEEGAPWQKRRH